MITKYTKIYIAGHRGMVGSAVWRALEVYADKFTYESKHDSMGMAELTEKLYGLCIAAGYHPDTVGECFYCNFHNITKIFRSYFFIRRYIVSFYRV